MSNGQLQAERFIGRRMTRTEDSRLLTGSGSLVDDVVMSGLLHAAFLRSPIAKGTIRSIDVSAALAIPGVWAVYIGSDFDPLGLDMRAGYDGPMPRRKIDPIARERVLYVGDPIAIVIAENRYLAEDGASMIEVEYEEEDPVVSLDQARDGSPVHSDMADNVAAAIGLPIDPELQEILANAPHLVTTTVLHQRIAHSSMETRGVVVARSGEDELTVHIGCQSPQTVARFLSDILQVPAGSIRVISKDVGGSFGLKARPWREEVAVIAAGMLLRRPIKWIEDRWEALVSSNQAREQELNLRTAFDKDGRVLASYAEGAINNGAYPHYPDANMAAMAFMWAAYKVPRYGFATQGLHSNTVGLAAYRGPWALESLARETQLDVAARKVGIDPIELRRRNLITSADQPYTNAMRMVLEDVTPFECLDELLRVFDIDVFRMEQAAARAEGRYLGVGVCTYIEPTATSQFGPMATEVAQVRIEPTGKVTAALGTHSQGQGTQTTMAQVIAQHLGVKFEDVSIFQEDSASVGFAAGAGGSRQAVAGGGAAIGASQRLIAKVKDIAAHLLNANSEAVTVADGMVTINGAPEMTRTLREIAEIAYGEPARLPAGMEPGLEVNYRYHQPPITYASAAHACVVEVDIDTGIVKILRWLASEDCGVVINPGIVEGQIAGGIAQAIGQVLLEKFNYDARGNPTTVTFKDYHLPTIVDVPDIEYTHVVTPAKGLGGFRGVGEGGNIIGPPTLINAIRDALAPFGEVAIDLPLTPAKLMKVILGQ